VGQPIGPKPSVLSGRAGTRSDAWTVRWRPSPSARLRLFCLPHTGGGASAYRGWAERLAPDIEVVALRLPGRESRLREEPYTRHDELVAALVANAEPLLDRPHAWFGHSMGALLGFEVCRTMRRLSLAEPTRLIVSAHPAPHLPTVDLPAADAASPAELLTWLRRLDATPAEVMAEPALLALVMPAIRADLAIGESYRFEAGPPLTCPISAFGGAMDPFATPGDVSGWAEHSTAGCTVRILRGGHFFVREHLGAVLSGVLADLA
jgi:surfactin synthase thioesterase subunit